MTAPGSLSKEDMDRLRKILANAEPIIRMAEYDKAKGIVAKRWVSIVISLAAIAGAVALLVAQGKTVLKWSGLI